MNFNRDQLQKMFGRVLETSPCPTHGAANISVCPRCDVVFCRADKDAKCACPDVSEGNTRGLLRELFFWVRGLEKTQPPFALVEKIQSVLKTPEDNA